MTAAPAAAVPTAPIDMELTQPDGSTFVAQQWGDEWNNGLETARGYAIVKDNASHYWVFAERGTSGHLAATDLRVGSDAPKDLRKHLRPDTSNVPRFDDVLGSAKSAVNKGTQHSLVILVQFPNKHGHTTAADWNSRFFDETSNSLHDYYDEVSYGQLEILAASETYGTPDDGVVGWLMMPYDHPNTGPVKVQKNYSLTWRAVRKANPYVDFASYDSNDDGYLSSSELHVTVIVAGFEWAIGGTPQGHPCGPSVAGHWSTLFGAHRPEVDGVVVGDKYHGGGYTQFGERHCYQPVAGGAYIRHQATLGVLVHEMGHDLGLPDLYDTNPDNGTSWGVGKWSVMAGGVWNYLPGEYWGSMPVYPDAFSRAYEGWVTPQQLVGANPGMSVPQVEPPPDPPLGYLGAVYQLRDNPEGIDWTWWKASPPPSGTPIPGTGEYFLVENRQKVGYDAALPGCGLLIWHIDETRTTTNDANADELRRLVDLEEADGLDHLDAYDRKHRGDDGDPYPGTSGNPVFSGDSYPNSDLYSGVPSGVSVSGNSSGCSSSMNMTAGFGLGALSVSDPSQNEGNSGTSSFAFIVSLSPALSTPVTVNYAVADGTAVDPGDYAKPASGQLTFLPGDPPKTVNVTVKGDTSFEPDETFSVNLSGVAGDAFILDGGVGTIVNDDTEAGPADLQIASGGDHTCALAPTGTVKCWGLNGSGQLGNGTISNAKKPVPVPGVSGAIQIAAGDAHTCALITGGTVKCWGYNNYGQLGNGVKITSLTPVGVSDLSDATQIAAGGTHTCAIVGGNAVKCWGYNGSGQLGNNTTTSSSTPVSVTGLSGVSQITAGIYHTCAVLSSGAVKCWGYNYYGQLGNGSKVLSKVPVDVSDVSDATQITGGTSHTCALIAGGTVNCWGYNAYGQLGNNKVTNSNTPVTVTGLSGAAQISGGENHTCAVVSGAKIKCWGRNLYGQLGNNTTTNSSTPVTVTGVSAFSRVTAGHGHTCALVSPSTVKCWGWNKYGQLGNDSWNNSPDPVDVIDP